MPGLVVTIGGRLDGSYEASLAKSLAISYRAAAKMETAMNAARLSSSKGMASSTQLKAGIVAFEELSAAAALAGKSTKFYDNQITALTFKLNALAIAEGRVNAEMLATAGNRAKQVAAMAGGSILRGSGNEFIAKPDPARFAKDYQQLLQNIHLGRKVQLPVDIVGIDRLKGTGKSNIDSVLRASGVHAAMSEKYTKSSEDIKVLDSDRLAILEAQEKKELSLLEIRRKAVRQSELQQKLQAFHAAGAEEQVEAKKAYVQSRGENMWRFRQIRLRNEEKSALVKAAAEEAALKRAGHLADISLIARQGGIGAASGGHGHKYGGQGGVISEVAVIGHELLQGRGSGRILGSISILAQRLGLLGKLVKSTAQAEIQLAFAENEKAGAMARAAIATEADVTATLAEKEAAIAASLAQNKLAKATTETAEMASATAKVTLGPLGYALMAVVVVIGLLVLAFKTLNKVIAMKNEAAKQSAELALENTLNISEEIDAQTRLADAIRKTEEAFRNLNEVKSDFMKLSDEAIDALRAESEAQQNLADAQTKSKLIQLEIDEKQGKLTHGNAIAKKAQIEANAVADKAANKQDAMDTEAVQRQRQYEQAQLHSAEAQGAADKASKELNRSPEGQQRALKLAETEKELKAVESHAAELRKTAAEADIYNVNPMVQSSERASQAKTLQTADQTDEIARVLAGSIEQQKNQMQPSELSAAQTMRKADAAKADELSLKDAARKSKADAENFRAHSDDAVTAEQNNILKQAKLDAMGNRHGPEGLNAMQKLGAFTAQGGNPLVEIGRRHTTLLERLVANSLAVHAHEVNKQGGVAH